MTVVTLILENSNEYISIHLGLLCHVYSVHVFPYATHTGLRGFSEPPATHLSKRSVWITYGCTITLEQVQHNVHRVVNEGPAQCIDTTQTYAFKPL